MKRVILGIDEVGRGPFAGPLVIGACILPENKEDYDWYFELNDSKKLSKNKRERLYTELEKDATFATGWVSAKEINEIGLSEALRLATRRAVEKIQEKKVPFSEIIIDGTTNFLEGTKLEKYVTTMIKGDFYVKEISAASIAAKVEHDRYMQEVAKKYPGYGFEKHVGYGTAKHHEAIRNLGLTPEHRTFIRKVAELGGVEWKDLKEKPVKDTTSKGVRAEGVVADYLKGKGHEILARNYKTKFYEVDIISKKQSTIYFTEVKYREDNRHGSPKEMVTPRKLKQMKFAAESFMKFKRLDCDFKIAVGTVVGKEFQFNEWFILEEV